MIGPEIFIVKEMGVVELLPAQRDMRIVIHRATLDERLINSHDATIIICDRDVTSAALKGLPFGTAIERSCKRARTRGSLSVLSTHVGAGAKPLVLAFVKPGAAAFERLTLGAKAWKELSGAAPQRVLIGTLNIDATMSSALLENFVAAALAGSAPMPSMKSKRVRQPQLEAITLCGDAVNIDVERALATDRGNHVARWLTALPPNVLDSAAYRRTLSALSKRAGWSFSFFDIAALKRVRAGAFLAVARGNEHADAGIVRIRYRARARSTVRAHLALVGKGICFDTGGINLKTHKGMFSMHEDMQGSAVAIGTLLALSAIDAPYDIDCWLAITENNIGPRAFRPQEVVTAANGVTIQVVHSDAEGRMVLADTLALAARERPDLMIDFATLTGACVVALTDRYSGVFTNRSEWHTALALAGRHSGERVWPFPLDDDFDAELESTIADVMQCTLDSKGDHILAARFLQRFVPAETPWIHIDLAASNRPGGLAYVPSDVTGFGVRYATHLLLDQGLIGGSRARRAKERK